MLDPAFAREQTAIFERDLERSTRVSYAQWAGRPLKEKLAERVTALLGSQL